MTDHEALVSLRKAVEHHATNEIPPCEEGLSTAHLEENARTTDARNKQTKAALDELSKATAAIRQSQQARRLTEANTDVSETRVSLGAQLDAARNALHTATDIAALNKAQTPHPASLRRHQTGRRSTIRAS